MGAATTPKHLNKSPGHSAAYAISPAYNNSPMPHMKQSAQYEVAGGGSYQQQTPAYQAAGIYTAPAGAANISPTGHISNSDYSSQNQYPQ